MHRETVFDGAMLGCHLSRVDKGIPVAYHIPRLVSIMCFTKDCG